jgi:C-terminal processing protease CtpA/Prc
LKSGFVLPVAAYLTWKGTVIEGTGVEPDVRVELSYETLQKNEDNQMEVALKIASAM